VQFNTGGSKGRKCPADKFIARGGEKKKTSPLVFFDLVFQIKSENPGIERGWEGGDGCVT